MLENQIWKTYWMLRIISEAWKKNNIRYVKCECECWNITEARLSSIRNWDTKSCWCYSYKKTHWLSNHPLYTTWTNMIQRTENKNHNRYYRYWARWIKVCDLWKDFYIFYQWAIDNWYSEWLQIDRIDNDWNYCPENCRFLSSKENSCNRSTNIIKWWLKNLCVERWLKYHTVYCRIRRWVPLNIALS